MQDKQRQKGAQSGNTNAVTSGIYRSYRQLDHRTKEAKVIRHAELTLGRALGNASPQESIIVHQIAVGLLRLSILERMMTKDAEGFDRDDLYLKWSRDVRDGLKVLGMSERDAPVEDLKSYLAAREAEGKVGKVVGQTEGDH